MKVFEVADHSCGFKTRIVVRKKDRDTIILNIASECKEVSRWGNEIMEVKWRECLGKNFLESRLCSSAARMLKHRSCSVPTAVLRAIEAEVGSAIAAGSTIRFLESET